MFRVIDFSLANNVQVKKKKKRERVIGQCENFWALGTDSCQGIPNSVENSSIFRL